MIGTRHFHRAKLPRHLRNALVIRGHNDFGQTRRLAQRSTTCCTSGLPAIRCSGLPGNRVDA